MTERTDQSHWDEDEDFPVEDWRTEVINDDTRQGYAEWVEEQRSRKAENPIPRFYVTTDKENFNIMFQLGDEPDQDHDPTLFYATTEDNRSIDVVMAVLSQAHAEILAVYGFRIDDYMIQPTR